MSSVGGGSLSIQSLPHCSLIFAFSISTHLAMRQGPSIWTPIRPLRNAQNNSMLWWLIFSKTLLIWSAIDNELTTLARVKHFIGFGAGAGASILVQYAVRKQSCCTCTCAGESITYPTTLQLHHESRVRGLLLVSLVAGGVGIGEKMSDMVDSLLNDHKHHMLHHWFDSVTRRTVFPPDRYLNDDLVWQEWLQHHNDEAEAWMKHAESLNHHNVRMFINTLKGYVNLTWCYVVNAISG